VGQQVIHEEIVKALEALKLGRTGVKGIPVDMMKGLGEQVTKEKILAQHMC